MSEEDNTPVEEVTPQEEPTGNLAAEASKAIDSESPRAALAAELTAEQLKQVERMVSQAVDGAQRKWADKQQEDLTAKGYLTPEQAKAIAQEEVQFAEQRTRAEANVELWMRDEGIEPGSEQATALSAEFKRGLDAGVYTHRMLLDKAGVKYLVAAAGLAPAQAQESLNLPRQSVPQGVPKREDGKPLTRRDMDELIRKNNLDAIQNMHGKKR
jgi:hypothetical protein